MEMLETETNYLNNLELMVNLFKEPLEKALYSTSSVADENHPSGKEQREILSKQQISIIFGKIPPIIDVHRNIKNSLENLMNNWDSRYHDTLIGYVWAVHGPELSKVYPPFVNSYDEARQTLEDCLTMIPKFHTFVKTAESDPKCRKITLKDMLIKPVQRLPSVVLLLNEIMKRTDKNHKDHECLRQGIVEIERVLRQSNQCRERTDAFKEFLHITGQIEGLPSVVINSNRQFLRKVELMVISGDSCFGEVKARTMTLFLFSDVVVFAKNRSTPGSTHSLNQSLFQTTRGTLTRNMSFLRSSGERKSFKYIHLCRIPDFKLARYEKSSEIFIVKVRDTEDGDLMFIGQANPPSTFEDVISFMNLLCQIVNQSTGKDLRMEELTEKVLSGMKGSVKEENENEDYNTIRKAIDTVHSGATIRRRSTLRRAVSNVSIGISHRLQKITSKARLGSINESSF